MDIGAFINGYISGFILSPFLIFSSMGQEPLKTIIYLFSFIFLGCIYESICVKLQFSYKKMIIYGFLCILLLNILSFLILFFYLVFVSGIEKSTLGSFFTIIPIEYGWGIIFANVTIYSIILGLGMSLILYKNIKEIEFLSLITNRLVLINLFLTVFLALSSLLFTIYFYINNYLYPLFANWILIVVTPFGGYLFGYIGLYIISKGRLVLIILLSIILFYFSYVIFVSDDYYARTNQYMNIILLGGPIFTFVFVIFIIFGMKTNVIINKLINKIE